MLIELRDTTNKTVARYKIEAPEKHIRLGDRVFSRGFWEAFFGGRVWRQVVTTEVKLKDRVKFDAKPNKRQPKQLSLLD